MLPLHIVHADDVTPQPWRNGGGVTRELVALPSREFWSLRVSVARIDRDGPFSAFPGVSRWFAVLRGNGVELSWPDNADMPTCTLTPNDEGTTFSGSEVPYCRLLDGATDDLNVMFNTPQRGLLAAQVCRVEPGVAWSVPTVGPVIGAWRAVYTDAACTLHVGDDATRRSHYVSARSLVWGDLSAHPALCATPWRLEAVLPVRAWWIAVTIPAPSE